MLVSAVVKRNSAVVPGSLCEANIPPTTINPLPIAIRVMTTCRRVNAPTDIPKIMEAPAVGPMPYEIYSVTLDRNCNLSCFDRLGCGTVVVFIHHGDESKVPLFALPPTAKASPVRTARPTISMRMIICGDIGLWSRHQLRRHLQQGEVVAIAASIRVGGRKHAEWIILK